MASVETVRGNRVVLSIGIDGEWMADTLSDFIGICSALYLLQTLTSFKLPAGRTENAPIDVRQRPLDFAKRSWGFTVARENEQLMISRLSYGSAGEIKYTGETAALAEIRKTVESIIFYTLRKKELKAELARKVFENRRLLIELNSLEEKHKEELDALRLMNESKRADIEIKRLAAESAELDNRRKEIENSKADLESRKLKADLEEADTKRLLRTRIAPWLSESDRELIYSDLNRAIYFLEQLAANGNITGVDLQ